MSQRKTKEVYKGLDDQRGKLSQCGQSLAFIEATDLQEFAAHGSLIA
jgi:hypothetical protein